MAADIGTSHAPTDPVEMRRLNFQTPGMISHPPIPISELANHIERLKANDNLKFSQEYEACKSIPAFNYSRLSVIHFADQLRCFFFPSSKAF
jgi:netrin-G3 ligand